MIALAQRLREHKGPKVSDQRDEFYQPWLREPATPQAAPVKRRYEPEADAPLARDEDLPLGVDLSGYVLDEVPPKPLPDRVKPVARAAGDGAARLWAASRRGAGHFADWTMRLGAQADVPARVAALEIPRRTGAAAQRGGLMLAAAGRVIGAGVVRLGAAGGRGLSIAGRQALGGIERAVAQGRAAGEKGIAKLRPETPATPPPGSGLDRLLAAETSAQAPALGDTGNLPLFSTTRPAPAVGGERVIASAAPPPAAQPMVSADERPARSSAPISRGTAGKSGGSGGIGSVFADMPRWMPWGAAALLLLVLSFWAGSRVGGGGMDRAEVEQIVAETIMANPQIIPQALEKYQANQMAATIDTIRPALEKPFSGAWIGNAKGDVTLTIFTDYGCVFCRASVPDVDRLVREDKGVKVVFRELPIIAPQSKDAAIAALAAARQGKYDAFHHAMFAAPSLDREAIDAASTRAGVILDGRSDANADVRLFEREIDSNLALAQQLGINGTPSWVVGSRLMQGAVGYSELKKAVAAARAAD
jgi:protein-disulfide isomerase